jgi:phosphoribosylformylglycinamidine synthase subunit PurQ / glutaminase
MNSSVIVFPGSNCDRDIAVALKKMQFKNQMVWHKETALPKSDLIVIPGGFSYGDYLRSGAIAGKSLIINEVIKAANDGCLILGICNGFQILTETGLLEGVLLRNKNLKFINKDINIKVINNDTRFSNQYKKDQILNINIAHNEGNYFTNSNHLQALNKENLIAFKYCNEYGNVNEVSNPNGSLENIAGIFNSKKNILGMMPHPERMIDDLISNTDGVNLFSSLLK